jgi:hypothetical protein
MEFVSVCGQQSKVPVALLVTGRVLASPVRDGRFFETRAVCPVARFVAST